MNRSMLLFIFVITSTGTESRMEHKDLKVQFIDNLARNGSYFWKCLAILYEDNLDFNDEWINDIKIPKIMMTPFFHINNPISTFPPDAYLVLLSQDSIFQMEAAIQKLWGSKLLDSTKTFIIFSDDANAPWQTLDVDQIVVQQKFKWNPRTNTNDKPFLQFRRYRSTSSLPLSSMTGSYDGNVFDSASKAILFDRSFDYGNREVKVTAFPSPPTTIRCHQSQADGELCGRDPHLIRAIGEVLHFRPKFVPPSPPEALWGYKLNGNWTGLIGQVSRGDTTLGVANIFMAQHYAEQVDMSYPYGNHNIAVFYQFILILDSYTLGISCSTFVTPPPDLLPQFYVLIKPFDFYLWTATICSLLIGGWIIQFFAWLYSRLFGSIERLQVYGEAMMENAQSITGVRSGSDRSSVWPVRLYVTNWWLFCFLLGTIYRTCLTSWLAISPISMPPIDTVAQLLHSNLKIYGLNPFLQDLVNHTTDPQIIRIGQRQQIVSKNVTIEDLMCRQNGNALYENQNFLNYLAVTMSPKASTSRGSLENLDPRLRLHVMRECLQTFPIVIAVAPKTPLKLHLTKVMHKIQASGLLDYWLDEVIHRGKWKGRRLKKNEPPQTLTLHALEGAFFLLLLCYAIDILIFAAEFIVHHIHAAVATKSG